MKRVLVTGENSYIGTSFVDYMKQYENEYSVDTISVRGKEWQKADFSVYDAIFHVAGIAHQKETKNNRHIYYEVNYELTKQIAKKAKNEGVKQFVFLSSMSVYGLNTGVITKDTKLTPKTAYGISKMKAERFLESIENDMFQVAIVRPPMVYGPGCKGNYKTLSNFAKRTFLFPSYKNKRSMIYVETLSMYIYSILKNSYGGIVCPQNKVHVSTEELVNTIAKINNKIVYNTILFNWIIKIGVGKSNILTKIFGDLTYDDTILLENEAYMHNEKELNFKDSILETES